MSETGLVSSLNIFTLIAVLLIAIALFLWFMRKRSNRHPMDTPEGEAALEERRRKAEQIREEEGRAKVPPEDK